MIRVCFAENALHNEKKKPTEVSNVESLVHMVCYFGANAQVSVLEPVINYLENSCQETLENSLGFLLS